MKKLYWHVTSNEDLSIFTSDLNEAKVLIEGDYDGYPELEREDIEVEYTLTPVYMTEEEFNNLPED